MRKVATTTFILLVFALIGTGLVALTHHLTAGRIADQRLKSRLRILNSILPSSLYDNLLEKDTIKVKSPRYLGTHEEVEVYRARLKGKPMAAVFAVIAPDGYNGNIKLLVAIHYSGKLAGVRVVEHQETPGLGDVIEMRKSNWTQRSFPGKSLNNPAPDKWKVRKDGGVFDQFTGATITPRAVVKAVHLALQYFQANRTMLFAPSTSDPNNSRIE